MRRILILLLVLSIISFAILPAASAQGEEPRREDKGDLIVLQLYGSYREMGRQQAELLGEDLREVYEYQLADFNRFIAGAGTLGWILNHVNIPLYTSIATIGEDSRLHHEVAGKKPALANVDWLEGDAMDPAAAGAEGRRPPISR